uniref:Uncharacterized protein n=1 Tax=uncultured bacterium esnapd14 TaxID=1366594 RepID=S5TMY6_9BACT|nr:hypothetical protein [uncultured bacterium esnapd14]
MSGANPLPVTVNGAANTVVAVNPGTRTLTLGTAAVQAVGHAVVSSVAPYSIRPAAKETAFQLASTDRATFSLFRDAVARLRKQNVPGPYVAHIDPDSEAQLFADQEFKDLYQGRGDSPTRRRSAIWPSVSSAASPGYATTKPSSNPLVRSTFTGRSWSVKAR